MYWYNSLIISTKLGTFATPDYGISSNQRNYPNTRFGVSTSVLFPDSEDLINACIYSRLRMNKTICGFALSTPTYIHARKHQQAFASKTFPLSLNVRYILPSARGKTSTYSCMRYEHCRRLDVFYLKPFFVKNYLMKPICGGINNCSNGRCREYEAMTTVIFFAFRVFIFPAL